MAKTSFAKKRARQSLRRRGRNQSVKARMRSLVKKVEKSSDLQQAIENLKTATKLLDKAAKLRVIHRNKAGRTKSRLMKLAFSKKKNQ